MDATTDTTRLGILNSVADRIDAIADKTTLRKSDSLSLEIGRPLFICSLEWPATFHLQLGMAGQFWRLAGHFLFAAWIGRPDRILNYKITNINMGFQRSATSSADRNEMCLGASYNVITTERSLLRPGFYILAFN